MPTITMTPGWAGPLAAVGAPPVVVQVAGVGVPGTDGAAGPNQISDTTALGTLTDAVADALFLLASNAAGDGARKITVTAILRAIMQAADAVGVRSALGAGDAVTSGTLAQFAATTSAQLAGVLSDETGTGVVVYNTNPTVVTPVLSGTVVIRQPSGMPGTDEVQISHDGTNGLVQSKDGEIRIVDASGYGIRIYKNGTLVEIDPLNSSTNQLVLGNNTGSTVTCGYWRSNGGSGNWEATGTGYKVTWNGDTGLGRAAARVVGLSNTSTAGATLSSIPLTPSQITADQNNYAPGVAMHYRLTSDASRTLTGLSVGQVDGQVAEFWNVGSNNIVLAHDSASSSAANQFLNSSGASITLASGEMAFLRWFSAEQSGSGGWRVVKG